MGRDTVSHSALSHPLPQRLDAEAGALGSMILRPSAVGALLARLEREHFHQDRNKHVFDAVKTLYGSGQGCDIVLVEEQLKRAQKLEDVGGFDYLRDLVEAVPSAANAVYYAAIVQSTWARRRLIEEGSRLITAGFDDALDPLETKADHVQRLAKIQAIAEVAEPNEAATRMGVTAQELMAMTFQAPQWIIPDLLPIGLSILAGRPKLGKSWLGLQIAVAVGSGGKALDRDVARGKALIIALEDSGRRLQERLTMMRVDAMTDVDFYTAWPNLQAGGVAEIQARIAEDGYRLVVVDTFSRAVGRADQMDGGEMTAILGNLQAAAIRSQSCVCLIDHHRKGGAHAPDPVDDVSGSTAKTAVPDCIWGLTRDRDPQSAILHVRGRDLEEVELSVSFDRTTFAWQLIGAADAVRKDSVAGRVLDAITDIVSIGGDATGKAISEHAEIHKSNVSKALRDLLKADLVVEGPRIGRSIPYTLPSL